MQIQRTQKYVEIDKCSSLQGFEAYPCKASRGFSWAVFSQCGNLVLETESESQDSCIEKVKGTSKCLIGECYLNMFKLIEKTLMVVNRVYTEAGDFGALLAIRALTQ